MLILIHFNTLINLYYSLVYPFLIYGLIVWGSTYTLNPLYLLQKRALRIMTFSKFDDHSRLLFKQTKIIKFHDLVVFLMAIFMHKYHSNLLPITFERFFVRVNEVHFLKGYSVLVRVEIIHKSKFLQGTVEKNSSTIRSSGRNRTYACAMPVHCSDH